jgi:outer membrane protein, multidrug efflux system
LAIMQARYDHGTIPMIDLNQSQIEYEVALSAIETYRWLIKYQMNRLSILLGEMPHSIDIEKAGMVLKSLLPPTIPMGVNSQLLQRRPDLMQQQYALKSQNAQIGVAVASRFPSLSLTGLLGVASPDLANFTMGGPAWSIGADLLGPLFQLNKTKYRVEVEKAKTEVLIEQYEKSIISAFSEVEYLITSISTFEVKDASAERKLGYATNAEKLSAARYDRGVTSYLEVLEAQRTLFSVGLEYADTRASYLTSFIQLYAALGGGWISEEEKQADAEAQKVAEAEAKESGEEVEEPSDKDLAKVEMESAKTRSEVRDKAANEEETK